MDRPPYPKRGLKMAKGIFKRLFGRRGKTRKLSYEDTDDRYYEPEPERSNESLLIDHRFVYRAEPGHEKHITGIEYLIRVENTTDYPMGNINVEFGRGTKQGVFGKVVGGGELLEPGQSLEMSAPFRPLYRGGKERFKFDIVFFDFNYKVEERLSLETEPLRVTVPKFSPLKKDEDGYRIIMSNLYRWTLETGVIKAPPGVIFDSLTDRLVKIGFHEANRMVNPSLYRGIGQFCGKDDKGRKWAAQIQVIGEKNESKTLLYCYAEKPQFAYNLATKVLLKLEEREKILPNLT